MAGFSPEWLALREPADTRARNPQVLASCARAFAGHDSLVICDMGAGTGASVRALADLLPQRQDWILVDHDHRNLAGAVTALTAWADGGDRQIIHRGERRIGLRTLHQDFAADPAPWPADTGLVTASALLDLPSHAWIDAFVAKLAARRLPALITLTVDGVMAAEPVQELDRPVFESFRRHQRGDKGFGPSAGAEAAPYLERALKNAGYTLECGDSPWIIDGASPALMQELLKGIAGAARETGFMAADEWLKDRLETTTRLTIGHRDVFASL
ncbi:MAG: hypothetical protein K1X51_15370 [Rhodospirillaceae bacterium]|nr:hypothetical protein [Rhodospirillaceae bacterium]